MPIASVTAKTLLISFMPTASSTLTLSRALTKIGGGPFSTGNGDRAAAVDAVGGQRRDGVLLVGDAPLVVARDQDVAPRLGQVEAALGDPSLAGRRRQRQRRGAAHRLLPHLFERARRSELLQGVPGRPPDPGRRDDLSRRYTGGGQHYQCREQRDDALHEAQRK